MPDFARSFRSHRLLANGPRALASDVLGLAGVCVTIVAALYLPVFA